MDSHAFLSVGSARGIEAILHRLFVHDVHMVKGAADCRSIFFAGFVVDVEDRDL